MKSKTVSGIMLTLLLMSMLALALSIEPVEAIRFIYIRAWGSIDPPSAPISNVDNTIYTFTDNIYDEIVVERDNIVVDGAGYTLQGTGVLFSKGIDLSSRSNVTIKNMEIKTFHYGIYLWYSSNNIVSGNSITNSVRGIELITSSNNNVSGNNVTNSEVGIAVFAEYMSKDNNLFGNSIANNTEGIYLRKSLNSSVYGNNITNNTYGLVLDWSFENEFYHNNFMNNTQQVHDESIQGILSRNVWDNGTSGGNYWDDYEERYPDAEEMDGSGMWDTPYVIDEKNRDNYPLANPWSPSWNSSWSPKPPIEEFPLWTQWWFWGAVAAVLVASAGAAFTLEKRKLPKPTAPHFMRSRLTFAASGSVYLSVLLASFLLVLFYPSFAPYCWLLVPAVANFFAGYLREETDMTIKIIIVGFSLQACIILVLLIFSPFHNAFLSIENFLAETVPSLGFSFGFYYYDLSLILSAIVLYYVVNIPLGITVSLVGMFVRENSSKIIAVCKLSARKTKQMIETLLKKVKR